MPTSSIALSPREQLDAPEAGRVALKFFFNLMEHWGCSAEQQRTLLGGVGNTTFYKYKHLPPFVVNAMLIALGKNYNFLFVLDNYKRKLFGSSKK